MVKSSIKSSTRKRKYRLQGGGTDSCKHPTNPSGQTSEGAPKMIPIVEDHLAVASPEQWICYGDTFTSCSTITIVMEDNWKMGVHMNASMFLFYDGSQTFNPITVIPVMRTLLTTHPKFKNSKIKKIYLITSLGSIILTKKTIPGGLFRRKKSELLETINNNSSSFRLMDDKSIEQILLTKNVVYATEFFRKVFPSHVTNTTQIVYDSDRELSSAGSDKHFFILEDGQLDLVT